MSMLIMARSSSNRNCASARASSVLPTPVGPRKMKLPIGRLGSFKPERARITASATAVTASSCPITRLCSSSSKCSSFCISPSSSCFILPDHALVQLIFQMQQLLHLAFQQLGHRHARPPADYLRDIFLAHLFFD